MLTKRRPSSALFAALAFGPLVAIACSSPEESRARFDPEPAPPSSAEPEPTAPRPTEVQTRPAETGQPGQENDAGSQPSSCPGAPKGSTCGVSPQCGCATTATCDVVGDDGATSCVPAGRFVRGAPCTATVGCAQGLTCVFGTCHAFCSSPGTACSQPGTGACIQVNRTGGSAIPGLAVCRTACDLRDAMSCGGTNGAGTGVCISDDEGGTECVSGGTRKLNETCATADDCGPSLVCVLGQSGTSGSCKRWCRVGTSDCGVAVTCRAFAPKVMAGGVEHGACP